MTRPTALAAGQRLALSAEVVSNTFDGSARSECETQDQVEAGKKHEMWVYFGLVKSRVAQGWEAVASSAHCGGASFDEKLALPGRGASIPYVIVIINSIPRVGAGGNVDLEIALETRKLSAFDGKGQPVYTRSDQKRRFDLATGAEALVPILVTDSHETEAFNVQELFLRLRASVLGREVAAYGTVSVTADVPGVDLLLDGGFVGRTLEDGPTILRNVLVGKREVSVKDFSGRSASKEVVVEKDRTVPADLKLLNLPSSRPLPDLVLIGKNPQGYEEYWRVRDGAVVVKVPSGEFLMGSAKDQGDPSERPQRRVFVSDFLMDKTEVTWRQFRKFHEATGAPFPPTPLWGTPGDYPVSSVLYDDAKAYCEWVGGRLPTEAEWEKADRGTDGREYPWGNEWDQDRCNSIQGGTHRPEGAGAFPDCVTPYGLVDMPGSVWEWCADWYADGYPEGPARDPKGPATGSGRVLRGGSWLSQPPWLRAAYRYKAGDPTWRNVHYGFRCVQSVPH
jgi:formylglycine-generating enzyme required for sulfatase activity